LPTLNYEALDVKRMELPPGWRGYGAKDYTDHPDTPARQAEVDALKQKMPDRFERQRALMPYEHLLPQRLRGKNERIDEPFAPGMPPPDETAPAGFVWENE
jgi:fumarate reductase flavoprotein subunit